MTRRTKYAVAISLVALFVTLVSMRMAVNRVVWKRIAAAVRDAYGVELTSEDLSLSLFDGRATARGVSFADNGTVILGVERIDLSTSLLDILGGAYTFEELVITRPVLRLVVEEGGRTNLARILARHEPTDGPSSVVHFQDARVIDGRVSIDDPHTDEDEASHVSIERIQIALTELQVAGEPRSSALGDIRVDAELAQKRSPARITLVGWAPPLNDKLTIALHGALTGLDLEQIPQYVRRSTRSALGGDVIHLGGSMRSRDGVILDGALAAQVVENGAEYSLRFGGTTSSIVFDEDSKLAALFRLPFVRLGHVGDVALTSTWGVAVDLGTGIVGAGKSLGGGLAKTIGGMVRLDPLGALEAAGGGVLGGAKSLGGGVIHGVKRLFGRGESKQDARDRRAQEQREFAELHEDCRLQMLAAALVSAEESSNSRARRIEHEIEAAKQDPADDEVLAKE